MPTFETGLSTAAANDVALTITNESSVYNQFKKARFPWEANRIVRQACNAYGRVEYGRSFSDAELTECVEYVIHAWSAE
jgi:hypothetical protein